MPKELKIEKKATATDLQLATRVRECVLALNHAVRAANEANLAVWIEWNGAGYNVSVKKEIE